MSSHPYKCPECEGSNFKCWELPHPIILHWVLNPGLAFNEVILGQRLPKTQLICKDCEGSMADRAYTPCPSCKTMHLSRLASGKKAFGNWRGVACPTCLEAIPCLWNVFSLLVLLVTLPLWGLPYFLHFKKLPVKPFYQLSDGEPPTQKPLTRKTWIIMGFTWGAFMWVFMTVFMAISSGKGVTWNSFWMGLPVWSVGGFVFGFSMWFFLGRKKHQPLDKP